MKLSDEEEKLIQKATEIRKAARAMRNAGLLNMEAAEASELGIMAIRQHHLIGVQQETIEQMDTLLHDLAKDYPDLEFRIASAARKILGDSVAKTEAFRKRLS